MASAPGATFCPRSMNVGLLSHAGSAQKLIGRITSHNPSNYQLNNENNENRLNFVLNQLGGKIFPYAGGSNILND